MKGQRAWGLFLFFVSREHRLYMSHSRRGQRGQTDVNDKKRCDDKGDDDMDK